VDQDRVDRPEPEDGREVADDDVPEGPWNVLGHDSLEIELERQRPLVVSPGDYGPGRDAEGAAIGWQRKLVAAVARNNHASAAEHMDSRLGRGCNCSQQAPKAFAPSARVGAGRPRLGPCGRSRR